MTDFCILMAIVFVFGASGRVCGIDKVPYDSVDEGYAQTIVEKFDPHCD